MYKVWSAYISPLFFTRRWYAAFTAVVILFVCRFFLSWLGIIPYLALLTLIVLGFVDYFLLFRNLKGLFGRRTHADRFSNGDDNPVQINVENRYPFPVRIEVIDEIPVQFQRRDILFRASAKAGQNVIINYTLRPVKRGAYHFGTVNVFVSTAIGLIIRRYKFEQPAEVPVYPSYIQMRKYQLMAISNRLTEAGVKKVRKLGHSMEFEQVKEYVSGDDYRTLNWKATARKGNLMVNSFTDEKSQPIYCVIDKGRVMKMPFEGMSLLDYAINASLVLTNVALLKQDKAGLVTFSEKAGAFLQADRNTTQMQLILEMLYNQKTRYLESNFEQLYLEIRRRINQRSLIVLFTNFESLTGMRRHLPYLRKIASHHLLLTVFFENTELRSAITSPTADLEDVYIKTVAEKFAYEKRLIAKELQQYGILSILTAPKDLTVNTLNKYLELKSRQLI
ncbi:MAG TPA: DUF58 domain-containing protein [Segetibacter sp.]|nr:DUF58 domain-containing protein [Segetibacter sp.]